MCQTDRLAGKFRTKCQRRLDYVAYEEINHLIQTSGDHASRDTVLFEYRWKTGWRETLLILLLCSLMVHKMQQFATKTTFGD